MSKEEMARIIGDNILKLLSYRNMKQVDLAKVLGVSESAVGKWTLGKNFPNMGTIEKIADYFGVNKSDLLNRESPNTDISHNIITRQSLKDNDRILLSHLGELSDEEQDFFRKQIERAAKERRESYDD